MSVRVKYEATPKITLEFDVEGQKGLVESLAQYSEVLSHDKCGKCKGGNLVFQVREVESNKFYEVRCKDCNAVLAFGAHKTGGTLFPKKFETVEEGGKDVKKRLPDGGWTKWDPELKKRV